MYRYSESAITSEKNGASRVELCSDFCYSNVEFEVMKEDIKVAKESGANGVIEK
ncbi:hypothetical protein HDU92_001365 [Lobulomyces angularis]|nr:hypothetical protein HDU92_001365 [Lobulomyces angularis]